jgi:extensin-like protein
MSVQQIRAWTRREAALWAIAARRAAACTAFAIAWVGAWLLGVWWLGASRVYADATDTTEARSAPSLEAPAASNGVKVLMPPAGGAPLSPLGGSREPHSRVSEAYALDALPREVSGSLSCPKVALSELKQGTGQEPSFSPAVVATPPFHERLHELQRIVREVSLAHYGRAPEAILVAASYDCRSVSGKNRRLSEHAFGNAIDVSGFRFADGLEVRVDRHWKAQGADEPHARFLEALTATLIERGVFRTLLGPAHPDHSDHFHFDMAPHAYVDL